MKKILSIGNSFSQDAQRYLYSIAKANGEDVKNVNLYIPGCELKTHYLNMLEDKRAYQYQYKGEWVGVLCSIKEALMSDDWDYVTVQQASHKSFDFNSYTPYIEELCDYIKKYAPKSKILFHHTWAYPDFSANDRGFASSEEMYHNINDAYKKVYNLINPDGIIMSGNAMITAYKANKDIVYRDNIHASLGFGRYMLGILWFKFLFGMSGDFSHISEYDETISEAEKDLAYQIAYDTVNDI